MPVAIIGFGSNAPQHHIIPREIVPAAYASLRAIGAPLGFSGLFRSVAWPDPNQPEYVNAVGALDTLLSAESVLAALMSIEAAFGRRRSHDPSRRYDPRTLDLDLLDHGGTISSSDDLTLPHPRMRDRAFVMRPLAALFPDWRHPVCGRTATELAALLDEPGTMRLEP